MTSESTEPAGDACYKAQSQLPNPLKKCAKCKKQSYCSRECQKADWKRHKPSCGHSASDRFSDPTSSSTIDTATGGPCYTPKPFTAIDNGTWLHNRPEEDVFRLLIDIYRMRIEDEYKFEGDVDEDSLYGGASPVQASRHFRRFLNNINRIDARRDKKLLPEWWSPAKLAKCVEFLLKDEYSNVGCAVEKHDVQDYYKQQLMPMQLRMAGENGG